MSAVIAFPRPRAGAFASTLALVRDLTRPAPANVVPVARPVALAEIRKALATRARAVAATPAELARANAAALRELDAGRSTAAAYALACSELTGRRNALLRPMPA